VGRPCRSIASPRALSGSFALIEVRDFARHRRFCRPFCWLVHYPQNPCEIVILSIQFNAKKIDGFNPETNIWKLTIETQRSRNFWTYTRSKKRLLKFEICFLSSVFAFFGCILLQILIYAVKTTHKYNYIWIIQIIYFFFWICCSERYVEKDLINKKEERIQVLHFHYNKRKCQMW